MAKPKKSSTTVYVRLDERVLRALRAQAEREHRSLSNMIRAVVTEHVDKSSPRPNGLHHQAAKTAQT
jgi:hypothetical protein